MPHRPRARRFALPSRTCLVLACVLVACQRPVERGWPTGKRRASGQVSAIDGREEGLWTFWFPDGQLREQGRYQDGVRVGRWKQWHANGQPRSEGERAWDESTHASERAGHWRFWYENGALEACGAYERGLREGSWDFYLDDGHLDGDRTGEYRHGELLR